MYYVYSISRCSVRLAELHCSQCQSDMFSSAVQPAPRMHPASVLPWLAVADPPAPSSLLLLQTGCGDYIGGSSGIVCFQRSASRISLRSRIRGAAPRCPAAAAAADTLNT